MNVSLLVATPQLTGSFFSHATLLMLEQEDGGALGLVINRLAGVVLQDVAREMGQQPPQRQMAQQQVYLGGPVETSGGWCLYRAPTGHTHEVQLGEHLWLSRDAQVLERLLGGTQEFRLLLGYAGWGQGQLQQEVQGGAWLWGELSDHEFDSLLWHTPQPECWTQSLELLGLKATQLAGSARA